MPVSSDTLIANLALSAIGNRSTIVSMSENSAEAQACSLHYTNVRDELLREAHWNFARKQLNLALLNDSTQNQPVPQPWVYEYAYPNDCLQIRELLPLIPTQQVNSAIFGFPNNGITNTFGALNSNPVIKFIVSTDTINGNTQTVILTNQPSAVAVYTYEVTNPSFFDPSFVYAFAGRLAARISIALNGDKKLVEMALQESEAIIAKAKARDGNEGIISSDRVPDWIRARGFAWSYQYPDGPWSGMDAFGNWAGF